MAEGDVNTMQVKPGPDKLTKGEQSVAYAQWQEAVSNVYAAVFGPLGRAMTIFEKNDAWDCVAAAYEEYRVLPVGADYGAVIERLRAQIEKVVSPEGTAVPGVGQSMWDRNKRQWETRTPDRDVDAYEMAFIFEVVEPYIAAQEAMYSELSPEARERLNEAVDTALGFYGGPSIYMEASSFEALWGRVRGLVDGEFQRAGGGTSKNERRAVMASLGECALRMLFGGVGEPDPYGAHGAYPYPVDSAEWEWLNQRG